MSAEQDGFEKLRRLLRLKRHEQPPPRYFNEFSGNVIAAIRAAEAKKRPEYFWDRLYAEAPWMRRLLHSLDNRPAVAAGFGAAVCALLITGLVTSQTMDVTPITVGPTLTQNETEIKAQGDVASAAPAIQPVFGTNGSHAAGSLFDQIQIDTQPVGFQVTPGK